MENLVRQEIPILILGRVHLTFLQKVCGRLHCLVASSPVPMDVPACRWFMHQEQYSNVLGRWNKASCIHPDRMHRQGKGAGDAWGQTVRGQPGCSPETRIGKISTEYKAENKRYWKSTVGYGGIR